MGAFVPAADCVVTTFLFTQGGKEVAMMPSFRKIGGGVTLLEIGSFNTLMANHFRAGPLQYMANDCAYQLTQSQRQHTPSDIAASNSVGAGTFGSLGGHAPNVLAMRYELRTDTIGRNYRGAIYWPSLDKDLITGDTYNSTVVSAILANLEGMRTYALSIGWEWVIRSKYNAGIIRSACVVTPVSSIVSNDNLIDVQRRRKPPAPVDDGDLMISFE